MTIKPVELDEEWLDQFPVWTWAEDDVREDLICPVPLAGKILPPDKSPLFIRATFRTSGGLQLRGHICWDTDEVYTIDLVIEEQSFGFNKRLPDLAEEDRVSIGKILGAEVTSNFFPISYHTEFRAPSGEAIIGEFPRPVAH